MQKLACSCSGRIDGSCSVEGECLRGLIRKVATEVVQTALRERSAKEAALWMGSFGQDSNPQLSNIQSVLTVADRSVAAWKDVESVFAFLDQLLAQAK